jgi:hypothetical protein
LPNGVFAGTCGDDIFAPSLASGPYPPDDWAVKLRKRCHKEILARKAFLAASAFFGRMQKTNRRSRLQVNIVVQVSASFSRSLPLNPYLAARYIVHLQRTEQQQDPRPKVPIASTTRQILEEVKAWYWLHHAPETMHVPLPTNLTITLVTPLKGLQQESHQS